MSETNFGEAGGRLDYGSYLAVPELLGLQRTRTEAHDELLFIVVHQVYELWFKQVLHELTAARDAMLAGDSYRAVHALRRVAVIERVLVTQIDVLETMRPQDFLAFRSELAPASGFQSIQFRAIEYLSGLRDRAYLDRLQLTPSDRDALEARLREASLWDAFLALLAGDGDPSLAAIAADRRRYGHLFDVAEALLDHDEALGLWRYRHVQMVERQLGTKSGTGGSSGASYLHTTLDKKLFPALWELRSAL
ncbi:MAG: tryptophan 2,3-dioxygenase [Acidimicrobiales bacterium]